MEELAKMFRYINMDEKEKLSVEYNIVMKVKENLTNEKYINRILISSVIILVLKEDKIKGAILEELAEALEIYLDNKKDIYKIKYAAFLLINEVLFHKKMNFELLLLVINRLKEIPIEEKNLKVYQLLIGFLLKRKDRLELNYLDIGNYPDSLADFEKVILVVINFFQKKKRIKRMQDFIWLKSVLINMNLDLRRKITFKEFYEYLLDNLQILNLLFRYISKDKLESILSFQSSLIIGISIIIFSKNKNKEVVLKKINGYFRENYFSKIEKEVALLDFVVNLIVNLSLVWNFAIEDKDDTSVITNKIQVNNNNYPNCFENQDNYRLNKVKKNKGRLLIKAIKEDDFKLIKELLDMRIDLNYADNNNRTPLIYAVKFEKLELVDRLIELGADLNLRDNKGRTALIEAIIVDNVKIVARLIEANSDTNVRYLGKTPLELAKDWNRSNIISVLDKGDIR